MSGIKTGRLDANTVLPINRVAVTLESLQQLKNGTFKVKIKEPNLNLLDMNHEGRYFSTIKDFGGGRYLMREIVTAATSEWENLE